MEAQKEVLAEGGAIAKAEASASAKIITWAITAPDKARGFFASASGMAKTHGLRLSKLSASGLPFETELRAHLALLSK